MKCEQDVIVCVLSEVSDVIVFTHQTHSLSRVTDQQPRWTVVLPLDTHWVPKVYAFPHRLAVVLDHRLEWYDQEGQHLSTIPHLLHHLYVNKDLYIVSEERPRTTCPRISCRWFCRTVALLSHPRWGFHVWTHEGSYHRSTRPADHVHGVYVNEDNQVVWSLRHGWATVYRMGGCSYEPYPKWCGDHQTFRCRRRDGTVLWDQFVGWKGVMKKLSAEPIQSCWLMGEWAFPMGRGVVLRLGEEAFVWPLEIGDRVVHADHEKWVIHRASLREVWFMCGEHCYRRFSEVDHVLAFHQNSFVAINHAASKVTFCV